MWGLADTRMHHCPKTSPPSLPPLLLCLISEARGPASRTHTRAHGCACAIVPRPHPR